MFCFRNAVTRSSLLCSRRPMQQSLSSTATPATLRPAGSAYLLYKDTYTNIWLSLAVLLLLLSLTLVSVLYWAGMLPNTERHHRLALRDIGNKLQSEQSGSDCTSDGAHQLAVLL